MDYPHSAITAHTTSEDWKAFVYVHVRSEFFPIDDAALTQVVQQWLLDNVAGIVSTTAERRDQVFPVTTLPTLPSS